MTDKEMPMETILFFFQNEAKNIPIQDFVMKNISCKFEISSHLVFHNEAKYIPRQDFMVMNVSCKFEKATIIL